MLDFVSSLVLWAFVAGCVLTVLFYGYALVLAHRRIDELDEFTVGRSGYATDNAVFKIMRMIRYMMAAWSPFLNRRTFPDRDFRELPTKLRRSLAFGFWLFLATAAVMLPVIAWYYLFEDRAV